MFALQTPFAMLSSFLASMVFALSIPLLRAQFVPRFYGCLLCKSPYYAQFVPHFYGMFALPIPLLRAQFLWVFALLIPLLRSVRSSLLCLSRRIFTCFCRINFFTYAAKYSVTLSTCHLITSLQFFYSM